MTLPAPQSPDESPNRCVVCDAVVDLNGSEIDDETRCPRCGKRLRKSAELANRVRSMLVAPLRKNDDPAEIDRLGFGGDSLEMIDFVMQLEDEGIVIPQDELLGATSIGDLVGLVVRYAD